MEVRSNPRIYPVEIQFDTNSYKYRLPDSNILRGKKLLGLFIVPQDLSGNGIAPSGRDLIANTLLPQAFLQLQQDSDNFYESVSLEYFKITDQFHTYQPMGDRVKGIDTSNSFVIFPSASARPTVGESLVLYFVFED
jgi:hypothetical protein